MDVKRIRYFNLKEDKQTVNGLILRLNSNSSLENRLKEMSPDGPDIKLINYNRYKNGRFNETADYEIISRKVNSKRLLVRTDNLGNLTFLKGPRKNYKVFITELNSSEAKAMKEDAEEWAGLTAYVGDNL